MTEALLTVAEVAELTKLDEETVRRAIKAGRLKASKPATQFRIRPEAVDAWIDATEVQPTVEAPAIAQRAAAAVSLPTSRPASSVRALMRKQREQRRAG